MKIALEKEEEEEEEGKSLQLTLLAAVSTTACPSSSSPRAHRSLKSQAMNKFFSEEEGRRMWGGRGRVVGRERGGGLKRMI